MADNDILYSSEEEANNIPLTNELSGDLYEPIHVKGLFENWFLDYASYVILERAVPTITDGFKPVQRRILHSMKELDDGRYNKVANIIGNTMKYHPHGDASIGDALVQVGQKNLLIDMQGNWGNIYTGDGAAAPRYIEARLSKFALDVVFNPKTTPWQLSYDGRNKEPIELPVKFPLLLAQGVEGIAVGLSSKILPHNFLELVDACIKHLQGKEFELFPDFITGGLIDVSKYNDGGRGGKVRVRAKISQQDKKTLVITDLPFGKTTSSLIESIILANDKGKIKIRKIEDNTSENVEIIIHLHPGVSPDITIDALYAFTDCELSISPNCCIIEDHSPKFTTVSHVLKASAQNTVNLLKLELEIRLKELEESWHFSSLEKIFIEKEIYQDIRECKTQQSIMEAVDKGFIPYRNLFKREITYDDYDRLIEIPIKRISKFNAFKADEYVKGLEVEMEEVKNHLAHIIDFTINYYKQILKKYGAGKERKTEIRCFDNINAANVIVATERLYVNREEGFIGTSLKKDEFVDECSDIDDVIVFREDGTCLITKVSGKTFVGQQIIHVAIFRKNDERTIYNMVYMDGDSKSTYIKRFAVKGVTRDKEYDLTKGAKGSKILYLTANPNGEAEVINIKLKPRPKLKKISFDYSFTEVAIKGRQSQGNILSKNPVAKIVLKDQGVSTLSAMDIYYDDVVRRLNTDQRGVLLGSFKGDDKILTIMSSGYYKLIGFELTTHFDEDMLHILKYNPKRPISAIYYDGELKHYFVKRFIPESSDKKVLFISDHSDSKLDFVSIDWLPVVELLFKTKEGKSKENESIELAEFIAVKGVKAKGNRLSAYDIKKVNPLPALPYEEVIEEEMDELESDEELLEDESSEELSEDGKEPPKFDDSKPVGGPAKQISLFDLD